PVPALDLRSLLVDRRLDFLIWHQQRGKSVAGAIPRGNSRRGKEWGARRGPATNATPPERAGEVLAILEHLRRGERLEDHETVRLRKDGTRFNVSLTISPMSATPGRVTTASVITRDITERKRGERRLAAEHGVARALAESATLECAARKVLQTVGET